MRNKKNCKKGVLTGNCAVKAPLLSQLTFGRTDGRMHAGEGEGAIKTFQRLMAVQTCSYNFLIPGLNDHLYTCSNLILKIIYLCHKYGIIKAYA